MSTTPDLPSLIALREALATRFNSEELRTLCSNLGVRYDDLAGEGAAGKARELLDYLARREHIPQLLRELKRTRPGQFGAQFDGLLAAEAALHALRPPVGDFTGRAAELDALVAHLSRDGGTAAITGLHGMGGIGKTELALAVAHRLREQYGDAGLLFELQPGGAALRPEALLANVIHAFQPEARLPEELAALQGIYCAVLAGKRGLLLLDNAAGAEQVRPLLPAPAGWAVIVTSRSRFTLPGGKLWDLALLPLEDAVALLRRLLADGGRADLAGTLSGADLPGILSGANPPSVLSGAERSRRTPDPPGLLSEADPSGILSGAERSRRTPAIPSGAAPPGILSGAERSRRTPGLPALAERCGRLPLALRLAAGFLAAYRDWSLADYLAALAQAPLAYLTSPGETPAQAVLGLSLDALRQRDPGLAARWAQLAVFPAGFDRAAAAAVWGELADAPAGDVDAWPAPAPLGEAETRQGLSALVQVSLLDYDPGRDAYALHDLLRECALAVAADLDAARLRHAWHYLRLGRAAEALYRQGGEGVVAGLRQYEGARPHLAAAWVALAQPAHDRPDAAALRWLNAYPDAVSYVLDLRAAPRERIPLLEAAARAAAALGDRRGEGGHLGSLGLAYWALGDARRAIQYHEPALAIHREIGDRRGEGNDLGNLGLAYVALGDARRAVAHYEPALAIHREIGDRRGEGNALGNLGSAYFDLGDARRAIEYYEPALAIHREIGERRGEANDLGNLGNAYRALGDARRAIEYYEPALAIHREIGDRCGEGNDLGNLGMAYADLGEARRAIECYEQALAIHRGIGDRRGEGYDLGNLGLAYAALGEAQRPIELYEQALAIHRETGDRIGEGNWLCDMGLAYEKLGEGPRMREMWAAALVIYEAVESPYAARVREWLAK